MKTLKWKKLNEPVPTDAKLIKTEWRETNEVADVTPLGTDYKQEEWALWEIIELGE